MRTMHFTCKTMGGEAKTDYFDTEVSKRKEMRIN